MSEWQMKRIKQLGTVVTGSTPPTADHKNYGDDILFIGPADLTDKRRIRESKSGLSERGALLSRELPLESVMITCIGILGRIGQLAERGATNQQINSIIPNSGVHPDFLFWIAHTLKPEMEKIAGLQVVPIVKKSALEELSVSLPPFPEQRTIAAILDTIDEAIRRTEALIAKLQKVKAGLLHDLLTRGLDEHGQLRDPLRHPEQFKQSELGLIPKEWEVKRLGEVAEVLGGYAFSSLDFIEMGVPLIRISNITSQGLDLSDCVFLPKHYWNIHRNFQSKTEDILVALSGATTGKSSFVGDEVGALVNQRVGIVRTMPFEAFSSRLLFAMINSIRFRDYVLIDAIGGAQPNISPKKLMDFLIPSPPSDEQDRMDARIRSLSEVLGRHASIYQKFVRTKQGLMQDLLTGRVRASEGLVER